MAFPKTQQQQRWSTFSFVKTASWICEGGSLRFGNEDKGFSSLAIMGHAGKDPVSLKKLKQGDGLWTARKELLGWIFDGAQRCIELPQDKVERITSELRSMAWQSRVQRKDFEKIRGRLRHACI